MSPYTIVLRITTVHVKVQFESRQRQLRKTDIVKAGTYIVSIDRKTTIYELKAYEIAFFFGNVYQAAHSNMFPYLTDLLVSLYCLYSSIAGLH